MAQSFEKAEIKADREVRGEERWEFHESLLGQSPGSYEGSEQGHIFACCKRLYSFCVVINPRFECGLWKDNRNFFRNPAADDGDCVPKTVWWKEWPDTGCLT